MEFQQSGILLSDSKFQQYFSLLPFRPFLPLIFYLESLFVYNQI